MRVKHVGLILGPMAFMIMKLMSHPGALSPQAWGVLALAAWMIIWWVTEAVPIPVTALLPMVCLPILGVVPMKAAAAPYADPVVFLFMGGFMIAITMEKWNLHRRIALSIVNLTGTNANGIILGFLLATAALSMWISNTATAVMMLPIGASVIDLLTRGERKYAQSDIRNFAICMMLVIAYGANIGGTATLIGTPPNVVFSSILRNNHNITVGFAQWLIIGIPFALAMLAVTYFMLVKVLFRNRLGSFEGGRKLIREELRKLGKISRGEGMIMTVFGLTALAWIIQQPVLKALGITVKDMDTLIAMTASIALFVIPVDRKEDTRLLDWKDTERLPWGILLLFGGGLSLANALKEVGLIDLIGQTFQEAHLSGLWVILGLTAVSLFLTEIMSNVALVTVLVPVVGAIAVGMDMNPLYPCIPVTLAASCAFMLPMSTPPNAIVFASGYLTIPQMMRAGIWLNLVAIGLIGLLAKFGIPLIF